MESSRILVQMQLDGLAEAKLLVISFSNVTRACTVEIQAKV